MGRRALRLLAVGMAAGLLAACAHRGELRTRGLEPLSSTEESLQQALAPRRVAVLIGVDRYEDPTFGTLLHAGEDAHALGEVLAAKTGGDFDEVTVLTGSETTRESVLAALQRVGLGLRAEDTVLVYFSGHGTLTRGDEGGKLFLLPSDATAGRLDATALELASVEDWFSGLPAIRKALILDACFNGQGKSSVDPALVDDAPALLRDVERVRLASLGSGEAHLYGATLGRPALEDDALGHGVYTWYLLQALSWARQQSDIDGDAVITAFEAHDWARGRTMEHTGGVQVPEAALRVVGRNDVVLVGGDRARAERDQALVFDYGPRPGRLAGATLLVDGRARGAFPGTVAIPPGVHHLELRGPDGELLADGYATLPRRGSVNLRELPVLMREDRVLLSARPAYGGGPAKTWGPLWGPGFVGLELAAGLRKARGAGRGLLAATRLGGGVSPTRDGVDGLVRRGRGMLWGALGLGWAGGPRRLRVRATWDTQVTLLPVARLPGEVHVTLPEEAGWLIFSGGPSVSVGVATGRRVSLLVGGSLQISPMRTGGAIAPHVFGLLHGGLEVAL